MRVSTETAFRVYNDDDGVYIEIRPDSDSLGMVEIVTTDKASIEYYGKIDVRLPIEIATEAAKAMIKCAEIIKETEDVETNS